MSDNNEYIKNEPKTDEDWAKYVENLKLDPKSLWKDKSNRSVKAPPLGKITDKKLYFKEKAIIRLRNDKVDISNVTSNGPMVFGFYPFRWVYAAYNAIKDYFFARGYRIFIKTPILEGTVKAAVNHVDTVRMHKIGELDKS